MAKVVWSVGLGAACAACGRFTKRPYNTVPTTASLQHSPYNNADCNAARVSEPNFAAWDPAVRADRIGERTCRDVSRSGRRVYCDGDCAKGLAASASAIATLEWISISSRVITMR